jgi:hypothetical protein
MRRNIDSRVPVPAVLLSVLTLLIGQHALAAGGVPGPQGRSFPAYQAAAPPRVSMVYGQPYLFPSFNSWGWFGGYYSPFLNLPSLPPARPYLPKYWWVEPYPSADPRQAGYNPASGYPRDEVTTLLLVTHPVKTRIVLDGIYVGTADYLGPIQLPLGEHTLRVEALGYEPSETVISVEQPVLQQLDIRLKPVASGVKPEPRL